MSKNQKKETFIMSFAKDLAKDRLTGYKNSAYDTVNKTIKEMIETSEDMMSTESNEERKKILAEKTNKITEKLSETFTKLASHESVDHPPHYGGDTKYEVIKVLEAWNLDFHLGNVVKYVARAGKKDKSKELQDLEKALWYLERKIELLKKEE